MRLEQIAVNGQAANFGVLKKSDNRILSDLGYSNETLSTLITEPLGVEIRTHKAGPCSQCRYFLGESHQRLL